MARRSGRKGRGRILPNTSKVDAKNERPLQTTSFKRKSKSPISSSTSETNKRRKYSDIKEELVANIIVKFNLALNELFYLKEYKSIIYWDPSDFSSAITTQVPELYKDFLNDPNLQLKWDEKIETTKGLINMPLRLQKKVIAEQEKELLEKFPYKQEVINRSKEAEANILNLLNSYNNEISKKDQATTNPKKVMNEKTRTGINGYGITHKNDDPQESDEESSIAAYRLKNIKYSIPPAIVTHPSHIPLWRPESSKQLDLSLSKDKDEILEYNPVPIQLITTSRSNYTNPDIQSKIREFLDHKFKAAIIDDSNTDYGNSPEEYEIIMKQQEYLLKRLYEKVNIEKSLELNGDKIERRKINLPHASNLKHSYDPFRSTATIAPKSQGSTNNLTYHDHFLMQGMAFSKIHQQMRKNRQLRTRKVAQMIEQHFKKKRGEKERLVREREQNLKRISRIAVQAVKKRWTQAQKVYRWLQLQKEEELKKIKGRQHLSQMLEHSTQLLEAQLNKPSKDTEFDSNDNETFSDSDDELSVTSKESSIKVEEKSTSNELKKDSELTIEELRKKYANLNEDELPSNSSFERENSSENDSIDASKVLSSLYTDVNPNENVEPEYLTEFTEDQKLLIKDLESSGGSNSILDNESPSDSDGSMNISTDIRTSDTDSDSDSDSDLNEESHKDDEKLSSKNAKAKPYSLASLFSKDIASDSSADESIATNSNIEDDDIMSTDDEEEPITPKQDLNELSSEKEVAEEEINGSKVQDVPVPSLLRGILRPYQKQGLNWLASLYNNSTNGILADEMGLGKTIQTISLLAYLACEHHIWGPHLIIVPTSVMLNWEMEFKKFAPGFKVLTYYGSPQQRAQKRKGWNKPNAFHVCITSYQLVVHDHQSFKRRKWRYMILDEAHNIKNFRSTRWRALLNFNTENRLLLTGTPLQNNLMELWSLLYFLMPSSKVNQAMPDGFANLEDFQTWFGKPVDRILESTSQGGNDVIDENERTTSKMDEETKNTVARLHQVLRPYLLRRLKKDVEKQMPGKYEHIVYCRLSKRQRFLYDDFMSRAKTKETLASGNFLSIINCLMQLRKVCNHPDLFEVRPIVTSFTMQKSVASAFGPIEASVRKNLLDNSFKNCINNSVLNLDITCLDQLNYFVSQSTNKLKTSKEFQNQIDQLDGLIGSALEYQKPGFSNFLQYYRFSKVQSQMNVRDKLKHIIYLNNLRCGRAPLLGESILKTLNSITNSKRSYSETYRDMTLSLLERTRSMNDVIEKYSVITPSVVALDMKDQLIPISTQRRIISKVFSGEIENPFHKSQVKLSIAFPDKSLLQYDCGKLQKLASLLQELTAGGHRALIFTQMTKVLDILEQFLNIHGYRYMRLDGATKIEDRQLLTERFNRDPKIPVFILSTRSGGLGINLTGADTVIFYDSDWNPAMDKQCQDRCHRIGQSRDVHIYRFVSEYTIESNILKKANQKRQLDNVVIQEGEFTTDYFGKLSVKDLVIDTGIVDEIPDKPLNVGGNMENALAEAEDADDRAAASAAMKEVQVDDEDFEEESKPATTEGTPYPTSAEEPMISNQKKIDAEDADYDDGIGHIDEYMLRFIADGYYWD